MSAVNSILIVGGGTAGWLTAAYLSQELGSYREDGVEITLVESSDIPSIGVGEGTFPSIKRTLEIIGIKEQDFIRGAEATFKQAIQFTDWCDNQGPAQKTYFHLFDPPRKLNGNIDIAPYWLMDKSPNKPPFAKVVSPQQDVCETYRGPKLRSDNDYFGRLNYAYHLDAGKFVSMLKERAKFARVEHVIGTVQHVNCNDEGELTSVDLKQGQNLKADFFIDCTGFSSLLIGQKLGAKYKCVKDVLFVDRAIAVQVPYATPETEIPCATISTAHAHGWTWDIGLHTRRGIGYVYSSQHTDEDFAESTLRNYINDKSASHSVRHIKMRTGYRPNPWQKNCVAIGLSGGFLEPLEATGISLTEASIKLLADYFPRSGNTELARLKFNRVMSRYYEQAVNFIKMHYCLSDRKDTAFWTDNRDPDTIPKELQTLLEFWKFNYPRDTDFEEWQKTFDQESYLYVLLGMNTCPDLSMNASAYPFEKYADTHFTAIQKLIKTAVSTLPSHRQLINQYIA